LPGELFGPILVTDALLDATGDRAWLQALLEAEAALADAEAEVGVVPPEAARAIGAACREVSLDAGQLGRAARAGGNPVIPLAAALRRAVPDGARPWVHWGATSQDILDTAAMLVSKRALALIEADLAGLARECANLAHAHRHTLMVGRTLLQPAVPITFGLKAAGWLVATLDARRDLVHAAGELAAQLGGAAGTLASLGDQGPAVAALFAHKLGLAEAVLPWHTARQRVARLACALGTAAGTASKVAWDVALLMQAEVGEATEPAAPGRGGSSTMPHKRNPVGAAVVGAACRQAQALVPVLLQAVVAEHERAVGAWQAEWGSLSELLALAGGAVARTRETVAGLEVHAPVMASNLERSRGAVMAERVSLALAPRLGREEAAAAVARAIASGRDLGDELGAEGLVGEDERAQWLDPRSYLGATGTWIDRALEAWGERR